MRGTDCKAHRHDSVVAQERHHLQPLSRGGPNRADNLRYLCANAHSDTHYLLDHIEDRAALAIRHDEVFMFPEEIFNAVPWELRRTFGPGIRDAALTGWLKYGTRFLAGEFLAHHMLWYTSGAAKDTATGAARLSYSAALELRRVDEMLDIVAARYGFRR